MSDGFKHHKGICNGGPYDGQARDYHQEEMPVIFQDPNRSGTYTFVPIGIDPEVGRWYWKGLTIK